jgi:hypothetical protein
MVINAKTHFENKTNSVIKRIEGFIDKELEDDNYEIYFRNNDFDLFVKYNMKKLYEDEGWDVEIVEADYVYDRDEHVIFTLNKNH